MNKQEVTRLIDETQKELAHFIAEMQAGREFDMTGFEAVASRVQKEIAALSKEEAVSFQEHIASMMEMLNTLQQGLEKQRDNVRRELEGLNRQIEANKAYSKPETK